MLYSINHDNKSKLWCGPAAIAAVSGVPTSSIHQLLRRIGNRKRVAGIHNWELAAALRELGFRLNAVQVPDKPTLAAFAKRARHMFANAPMVVQITHHYVVLMGKRMVDNHVMSPVWISECPHRRARVEFAWQVVRVNEFVPPVIEKPKRKKSLWPKIRELASKHGISIEPDGHNWWLVSCDEFGDDDPLEGSHYAHGAEEVLEKVKLYIEHIESGYLEAATDPSAKPLSWWVQRCIRRRPMSVMDIACELSLEHGVDANPAKVRGAALQLIRCRLAQYRRGKLREATL